MLIVNSPKPRTPKFVGGGPTLRHLHSGLPAQSVTNGVRWTYFHPWKSNLKLIIALLEQHYNYLSHTRQLLAHAHGPKTCRPGWAPVPLHTEAALLWGLGREASRELPGQEAQHIHSPACGQPRRVVGKKCKFNGQVKNFVSCPFVPLCTDSRGRELPHLYHFRSQLQTLPIR